MIIDGTRANVKKDFTKLTIGHCCMLRSYLILTRLPPTVQKKVQDPFQHFHDGNERETSVETQHPADRAYEARPLFKKI